MTDDSPGFRGQPRVIEDDGWTDEMNALLRDEVQEEEGSCWGGGYPADRVQQFCGGGPLEEQGFF